MKIKVLIITVALLAAGAGGYLVTKKDDTSSQTNTSTSTDSGTETKNSEDMNTSLADLTLPGQSVGVEADCSFYTTEEITGIWGVPIVDMDLGTVVSTSDDGKQYICTYNETDSGLGLTFSVEYREFLSEEQAKTDMMNVRDGAKVGDEVYFIQDEQPGIGDEALFTVSKKSVDSGNNKVEQLYVRKGHVVMLLTASNLQGVKSDYRDKILQSYKLHFE
jgi:hypothetical protein